MKSFSFYFATYFLLSLCAPFANAEDAKPNVTLAEQFKTKGYATCMVGKWHLGAEPEFSMLKQGFDSYYGMPCNFSHDPRFFDGEEVVFEKTPLNQFSELYTERVRDFIRKQGDPRRMRPKQNQPRENHENKIH